MSPAGLHNIQFNALKHHLGAIAHFIATCPVAELPQQLKILGGSQMDLYLGHLQVNDIGAATLAALQAAGITSQAAYAHWLLQHHGYRKITLPDQSVWILRMGQEETGKYIHIHPGRYSPHTVRVKATVLKTAIALAFYRKNELVKTVDLVTLNQVRAAVINLPPVKDLAECRHILTVMEQVMACF
jgi:hypothetical protein